MRLLLFSVWLFISTPLVAESLDGPGHYQRGVELMDGGGDLSLALDHFRQAAEFGFQPLGSEYRISRILARQGDKEAALNSVEALAKGGFSFIHLIENEPDYDLLRNDARYAAAESQIRSARYPCETNPLKRDFDFWIGEWEVSQAGQFAGNNSISKILGGCALFEQWTSSSGVLGKSFNYYDPAHDHWRQIWIDDVGTVIEFTGKAIDGGIYYTAETVAGDVVTYHKFEFTRNDDGSVRQFWQTSTNKKDWATIWDGHYQLRKE